MTLVPRRVVPGRRYSTVVLVLQYCSATGYCTELYEVTAGERDPEIGGTQSELRVTSLYLTLPPGWSGARKYRLGNSGGTLIKLKQN